MPLSVTHERCTDTVYGERRLAHAVIIRAFRDLDRWLTEWKRALTAERTTKRTEKLRQLKRNIAESLWFLRGDGRWRPMTLFYFSALGHRPLTNAEIAVALVELRRKPYEISSREQGEEEG